MERQFSCLQCQISKRYCFYGVRVIKCIISILKSIHQFLMILIKVKKMICRSQDHVRSLRKKDGIQPVYHQTEGSKAPDHYNDIIKISFSESYPQD